MFIDSADFDSTHIYSSWYVTSPQIFAHIYKINLTSYAQEGYCKLQSTTAPATHTASKIKVGTTRIYIVTYSAPNLDFLELSKDLTTIFSPFHLSNFIQVGYIGGFELINSVFYITLSSNTNSSGYLITLTQSSNTMHTFEYGLPNFWHLILF